MEEPEEKAQAGFPKTVPIIRDLNLNPSCDHGPTILFERDGRQFFSCSAFRSRKLCRFYMPLEEWKGQVHDDEQHSDVPPKKKLKMAMDKTDHPLNLPNQRDKGEAQYHFNEKTKNFLLSQLKTLGVDSVLCIGTPSLHEEIRNSKSKDSLNPMISFLLDIDNRFSNLYPNDFALYNMCNHHFFRNREKYESFLEKSKRLAVIVDPPFGVKVELIWHGCLTGTKHDYENLCSSSIKAKVEVFWIFPYFMEGHILNKCPEAKFQMSDFHVEYSNHKKYSGSSKSKSSPIRVFTTVPLTDIHLPDEEYRFCELCLKWVDLKNKHCNSCGSCTTKDGGPTYEHCKKCKKCVKPSWKHCNSCKVCHLADSCVKLYGKISSKNNVASLYPNNCNTKRRNKKRK